MSLRVAIQMDPIETVNINADSSFVLALEAQKRGHDLYHYLPQDMSFKEGKISAHARRLKVRREHGNHYELGSYEDIDLSTFDIILMRQDPPFDMAYITATHMLEQLSDTTSVFNNPVEVRNAPEKIFITKFPELMPPTLISSHADDIEAFRRDYKDIVIKPLYGNGGAGVFHLKPDDENLTSLMEMFTEFYREPVIVQKYLPEVRQGDKRIILIDGKPAGAAMRIPADGEARANLHVGGAAEPSKLTAREEEICAAIGPDLKARGLVFTGIDVIGDYLTEINVTSPTLIQEINQFDNVCLESDLWDVFEQRHQDEVKVPKNLKTA